MGTAAGVDGNDLTTVSDNDISAYSGRARPGFEKLLVATKHLAVAVVAQPASIVLAVAVGLGATLPYGTMRRIQR
jgi:hypothetical protein